MGKPAVRSAVHKQLAHELGDALLAFIQGAGRDAFPSCLSCAYFVEHTNGHDRRAFCTMFNGYPPPQVVRDGCDRYIDQHQVPF